MKPWATHVLVVNERDFYLREDVYGLALYADSGAAVMYMRDDGSYDLAAANQHQGRAWELYALAPHRVGGAS